MSHIAQARVAVDRKVEAANRSRLAREMGCDRTHVSKVLSGQYMPSLPLAANLARRLGVSLDDFYGYLERSVTLVGAAN